MTNDKVNWKELRAPLTQLEQIHWNCCRNTLESVGLHVRVLTKDCEIFIAYRKTPSQNGYTGDGYFRVSDDTLIEGAVYWSYL